MVFLFYYKKFFQNLFLSESSRNSIKKFFIFLNFLVVYLCSEQKFLDLAYLLGLVRALLESPSSISFNFWRVWTISESALFLPSKLIFFTNFCGTVLEIQYYIRVRVSNRACTVLVVL